ncbi:hypothetical protein L6R50_14690 [Myxococcota bacterium]|nr:hypothetical protein [Myxococcota bacterium]
MEFGPRRRGTVVVRGGALGDVLLALPLLRALRARPESSPVVFFAPSRGGRLAAEVGLADRWERLDAPDFEERLGRAVAAATDVVWLRGDVEARRPGMEAAGVRVAGGDPHPRGGVHVSDHLLALAGLPGPADAAPMDLPSGSMGRGSAALRTAGLDPSRAVALAPGSGKVATRWPAPRFAALAEALTGKGWQPYWLMGPVEMELDSAPPRGGPVLAPQDPLETAGLLAAGRAYAGNDTGTTHLAAAAGAPTLALFFATDPRAYAPRGNVRVLAGGGGGAGGGPPAVADAERALLDLLADPGPR